MHASTVGTIAEKKFALKCLELDVPVLTPLVDKNGFDFVIEKSNCYAKIQVKSTLAQDKRKPNTYRFTVKRGMDGVAYSRGDYDYLVCYIFELNIFYIIPFDYVSASTIRISPNSHRCQYHKFKETWDLLR